MSYYSENIVMEKPQIEIEYCVKCKWLLRATWIAQELLSTFSDEIGSINILPSNVAGIFEICIGRELIWERSKKKGMLAIKELKQVVRDFIAPGKNLGHIDS